MIYRLLVLSLSLGWLTTTSSAQQPDSVRRYIDTALQHMERHSLYSNTVDWRTLSDSVYRRAAHASSYADAWPALAYAFRQLKDPHGMIAGPDSMYRFPPRVDPASRLSEGIKKEYLKGNRVVTSQLPGGVVYLRVPSMNGTSREVVEQKANSLRDSLCRLLATRPRGIILDLRMNNGGNSVPMLSGAGPLFQRTVLGYGVDKDGNTTDTTTLLHGTSARGGRALVTMRSTCTAAPSTPIAVLIGPSTVSSGEIMAVYLRQQENVKLVGEPTAGFCNATEGFVFGNRQGYLLLATNFIADASGKVYREEYVTPHIYVQSNDNYDNLLQDPTVQAALKWLDAEGSKPPGH